MTRWLTLPTDRPVLLGEGDVVRVRTPDGEERDATYERSPGGGHGFYDDGGEPVDAVAIEVT